MQMIEANITQRSTLPLPSATLIIDLRGEENDDIIQSLEVEIADLANEMGFLHHWRYLPDFLSFLAISPLSPEEVATLRPGKATQNGHRHNGHQPSTGKIEKSSQSSFQAGLTGRIDPSTQRGFSSPFLFETEEDVGSVSGDRPADILQLNLRTITTEIDRIRNCRIAAAMDLSKTAINTRSTKDATVRVIFLTDINSTDSLASAAAYAVHIKEHFKKKERLDRQPMVGTTVLCLSNRGEAAADPELKELLWDDHWDHLDSLVLTESYRDDAALIAGAVQAYVAELLLYVLLLVPPLGVAPVVGTDPSPSSAPQENGGKWVSLPPSTYLVGLAAMEHSARWGRRLLNYKVVERAAEVMQKDCEEERSGIRNTVRTWLNNWRGRIKEAIPEKVPGDIPALEAIPHAARLTKKTPDTIFTSNAFSLSVTKTTITDLREHLSDLAATYLHPTQDPGDQQTPAVQHSSRTPTLQDAIDSTAQITQLLREWEGKDLEVKKGASLVKEQVEAQQVLSDPSFFTGVQGAIPRAKIQLEELSNAASQLQNKHRLNPIKLADKKQELEDYGNKQINALREHIESFPLLAASWGLKWWLAVFTLILIFAMSFVTTFLGLVWFRHLLQYLNNIDSPFALPNALETLDTALFLTTPAVALTFWLVILGIIVATVVLLGRTLLDKQRRAITVEAVFLLFLVLPALSGLLISFSIAEMGRDIESKYLLSWLAFFTPLSIILLIVAAIIITVEIVDFIRWFNHLSQERIRIVERLNKQHADNIDTVRGFIADTVALKLLVRTGLIDGSGGPGAYYNRMSQLHNRLREILINAQRQQELARKRLAMSVSKTQQGTAVASRGRWLNLRIRDELLDVQSLADGYNRLTKRLDQEIEELQEFSELLMRMMGEETPAEIEQEFRERISQGYREQHSVQVLMTTLAAMALRLSIAPPSESTMTPLIRRYDSMTSSSAQQLPAMWYLIETLREKVSQSVLQPGHNGNNHQTETNAMATNAFAAWGQMLWEHKDIELENTLSREGVMPKLLEKDNDEHIVRRLLGLRTSLFGRSIQTGQLGELYLLLPPSSQSRRFRQNLNLRGRQIVDFPDVERLLLLYVRHYVAEPLFIPEPPPAAELPAPQAEPVAELPPPQPQPAHNTTEEDTTSDDASSVAKPEDDTEDTSQDQHQDQDIHNAVTEVLSPPTGADQSTPAAAPGPDPQAQPQVQMPLPPADSDIPDPNAQGTPQLFEDEDEDEL